MADRPQPAPTPVRLVVSHESAGLRLDQVMSEMVEGESRTRLAGWIKSGEVQVDGVVVTRPAQPLESGSVIEFRPPPMVRRSGGVAQITILRDEPSFALIDKPAGVISHPSIAIRGGTVSEQAEALFGSLPDPHGPDDDSEEDSRRPGIVHRLDARTTGVMIIAKTPAAAEFFVEAFAQRRVSKTYLALVHGEPRFISDWIEARIGRDARHADRMAVVREGEGRDAETYYEIKERFEGYALLEVSPRTGRTHQIRVHLESIELPIVGDPLYRGRHKHRGLPADAPAMDRQALHAWRIEFDHPDGSGKVIGEAPLPADMSSLLEWLRVHAPRGGVSTA